MEINNNMSDDNKHGKSTEEPIHKQCSPRLELKKKDSLAALMSPAMPVHCK